MFLLEMLFDLFTAIPFWLSLTFIFCNLKFRRNNEHRKIYKRSCIALGTVNLFLIGLHYMAIFNSGPLHGVLLLRRIGLQQLGLQCVCRAGWQLLQFNCITTSTESN